MNEIINYMGTHWYSVEGSIITIGLSEEGLEEFGSIESIDFPSENEDVARDESFGEIETDEGLISIYSPITGTIIEINQAAIDDPAIIIDSPYEEGWLVRVEADDIGELNDPGKDQDDDDWDDD